MRINVIGAGIAGLTTALALEDDGHDVQIITADQTEQTTSAVAAAFWYPFSVDGFYKQVWAEQTLAQYRREMQVDDPTTIGLSEVPVHEYFHDLEAMGEALGRGESRAGYMWWLPEDQSHPLDVPNDQTLVGRSFRIPRYSSRKTPRTKWKWYEFDISGSVCFKTVVIHSATYLEHLRARLRGTVKPTPVRLVDDAMAIGTPDAVVNCAGSGAARLLAIGPDRDREARFCKPRGGQLVRVENAEVDHITFLHTGDHFDQHPLYVVPRTGRTNDVILGGTLQTFRREAAGCRRQTVSNYSDLKLRGLFETIQAQIRERCSILVPALTQSTFMESYRGFRPVRTDGGPIEIERSASAHEFTSDMSGVRVELDLEGQLLSGTLVHNYGHGGAGFTLCWGCAYEVRDIFRRLA